MFCVVYGGVVANCIVLGWVMLAMAKVATAAFGWPEVVEIPWGGQTIDLPGKAVLLGVLVVTLAYTMLSGLWGVVATDMLQFIVAMAGALALMILVYIDVGGPARLAQKLQNHPDVSPQTLLYVPDLAHAAGMAVFTFAVYLSVQWWAASGAANNGIVNQRLLAMRNERHATYGMLWGNFAHYVLRTWPWVVVGLASFLYFPIAKNEDPELAYPRMMLHLLPSGLRGLMVVAFVAAFMSTVDSYLNWGASYVVNDFYKRLIRPDAPERHYVAISRAATIVLVILAALTAWQMETIAGAWKYLAQLGAGAGLVVLLRWF